MSLIDWLQDKDLGAARVGRIAVQVSRDDAGRTLVSMEDGMWTLLQLLQSAYRDHEADKRRLMACYLAETLRTRIDIAEKLLTEEFDVIFACEERIVLRLVETD
jgi:hypothetical protein